MAKGHLAPIEITVLGSGTSTGIPSIGCNCEVCLSDKPENKRLRSSIYIDHPSQKILVDCSSDFRQQALRYKMPRIDAVLLTHDHADHIGGIDDIRNYNFIQKEPIDFYASSATLATVRKRFGYIFEPTQIGGGLPQIRLHPVAGEKPFQLGDLEILPVPLKHGVLDIFGFRIGRRFAYLTDCSTVPEKSMAWLEGLDTLVVDALRPEPHSTHFSLDEALEFSRKVKPRQTWFTHMAHKLEHFATNAALPPEAQLLRDGQIFKVEACRL